MSVDWQPNLVGTRILLRPLAETDFDSLYRVASDPLIWEQHPDRLRYTRERFLVYFRTGMESQGGLVVIDLQSGEIIGGSRYRDHKPDESSVEVGYTFLARKYWGAGYNGELKRLMLDHAFRFVDTVFFLVGAENRRSRKAMSKVGAVEASVHPANTRDVVVYEMRKASRETRI